MAIRQWPRHQRPREKLLIQGAKALSNAELLAIFLRTGVQGMSSRPSRVFAGSLRGSWAAA